MIEYTIKSQGRNSYGRMSPQTFVVKYYADGEDDSPYRNRTGVNIKWACGDTLGGWTVEEFEDLLKQIAKVPVSKGLILPVEIPDYDTYGVMLRDDGIIMYGNGVGYIDNQGPPLAELRKALAAIKRHIKKQAAQTEKEKMTTFQKERAMA